MLNIMCELIAEITFELKLTDLAKKKYIYIYYSVKLQLDKTSYLGHNIKRIVVYLKFSFKRAACILSDHST